MMKFIFLMFFVLSSHAWSNNPIPARGESGAGNQKKNRNDEAADKYNKNEQVSKITHSTNPPRTVIHGANEKTAPHDRNNENKENSCENNFFNLSCIKIFIIGITSTTISNIIYFLQFIVLIVTVVVMIKSSRRQIRAYIAFHRIDISKKRTIKVVLKNSGSTPAIDVIHMVVCDFSKEAMGKKEIIDRHKNEDSPSVIGSGAEYEVFFTLNKDVLPNDIVYFRCLVVYKDIFGKKRDTIFNLEGTCGNNGCVEFIPRGMNNIT